MKKVPDTFSAIIVSTVRGNDVFELEKAFASSFRAGPHAPLRRWMGYVGAKIDIARIEVHRFNASREVHSRPSDT